MIKAEHRLLGFYHIGTGRTERILQCPPHYGSEYIAGTYVVQEKQPFFEGGI